MSYLQTLEADRQKKSDKLRELGVDPYGTTTQPDRLVKIREIQGYNQKNLDNLSEEPADPILPYDVTVRGRVISKNTRGKLRFFFIQDPTGKIQLMFKIDDYSSEEWEAICQIDVYDHLEVAGKAMRTQTGELTIHTRKFTFKGKSIAPPPEKFHGVQDEETLTRQRYLAMVLDPKIRENLTTRSKVMQSLRNRLDSHGYLEVETPILSQHANGANAKPFKTHHNSLDEDFNLRVAPELDLKRLLVGGMDKVYEMGRVFRNEGVDRTHNPEFTILECYEAYGDSGIIMDLCEDLIKWVFQSRDYNNFKGQVPKFQKISVATMIYEGFGIDVLEREEVATCCKAALLGDQGYEANVDNLLDSLLSHRTGDPLFVMYHPAEMCPLARRTPENPRLADRFELFFFDGNEAIEVANGYSELNDPVQQLKNFEDQASYQIREELLLRNPGIDEEDIDKYIAENAMSRIDTDYVNALKVGMPMAGGLGIGIDRLVMLLTGSKSIRDVLAFPLNRRKK
jgi:lysyl-tRNA synthetase class 2